MSARVLCNAASRAARSRTSLLLLTSATIPTRVAPRLVNSTRAYATEPAKSSGSSTALWWGVGLLGASAGYYFFSSSTPAKPLVVPVIKEEKKPLDYTEVYKAIADILEENPDYDDGSYGPVLVRLAWHASGTYNKEDGTGGSNGATMRFDPEGSHGANAGLVTARDLLEKIKKQFPEISYSDLWTLAGVVAVQELGGPTVPWRPGRADKSSTQDCSPDGRLPNAALGQDHVRNVFYRMGFNDQEIVALAGAHALGRCHTDRSGFDGPWTPSPTLFTNDYYTQLLTQRWVEKKWKGPKQYVDKATGGLMMLPADMAFIWDKQFKKFVELYSKDQQKFFDDFSAAFAKLLELGVPFKGDEKVYRFPTLNA